MTKVSTAQKAGVVVRVASQQVKRSRTVRALTGAVKTTARTIGNVLHQLWLEVIGVIFLIVAASGAAAVAREYTRFQAGKAGFGRLALAICFTLTFAWFGISSFWRVRQKSRKAR